jgi:hypothetical protein
MISRLTLMVVVPTVMSVVATFLVVALVLGAGLLVAALVMLAILAVAFVMSSRETGGFQKAKNTRLTQFVNSVNALLRNVEDGKVVALEALVLVLAPLAAALAAVLVLALAVRAGLLVVALLALAILVVAFVTSMAAVVSQKPRIPN